jgi:hypothetical protein
MRKYILILTFGLLFATLVEVIGLQARVHRGPVELAGMHGEMPESPGTPFIWDYMNIVPAYFATRIPPGFHDVSVSEKVYQVLVFVQWFAVGSCLYWLRLRFFGHEKRTRDA